MRALTACRSALRNGIALLIMIGASASCGKNSLFHPVASDPRHDMSAAFIGDVNGDRHSDVVASYLDYWPDGGGARSRVTVHCGRTGATLARPFESDDFDLLCWSVHAAGDVNGDGTFDAAYVLMDIDRRYSVGIHVFSGRDGTAIKQFAPSETSSSFGMAFACTGDLDLDGADDFLVGEPWSSNRGPAGRAVLLSGRTGVVIREHVGEASNHLGKVVSALPDCDGDGVRDYAVSRESYSDGRCFLTSILHSGRTGAMLREHEGVVSMLSASKLDSRPKVGSYLLSDPIARVSLLELDDHGSVVTVARYGNENGGAAMESSTALSANAMTDGAQIVAGSYPILAIPVAVSEGATLTRVIRWLCGTEVEGGAGSSQLRVTGGSRGLDPATESLWRSAQQLGPYVLPVSSTRPDDSRVPDLAFIRRLDATRSLVVSDGSGLVVLAELDPIQKPR